MLRDRVVASFDPTPLMREGEHARSCIDCALDVLVDQASIHEERFREEPDLPFRKVESHKCDLPLPPGKTPAVLGERLGQQPPALCHVNSPGGSLTQRGVAMLGVMELLEPREFSS